MAPSTCNTRKFRNYLKPNQVEDFLRAMYLRGSFSDLVNPRHVSASLNLDQHATMKSIRPQDG
jgi:hypothetical protein